MSSINPISVKIEKCIEYIDTGKYKLPAFQRDYEWGEKDVVKLLDSIFHNYPTGSLLTISGRPDMAEKQFNDSKGVEKTNTLILDGQQRLTSCYHAFYNKGRQYKDGTKYYYLDIPKLYDRWIAYNKEIEKIDLVDEVIIRVIKGKQGPVSITSDGLLPFWALKNSDLFGSAMKPYKAAHTDDEEYYDFLDIKLPSMVSPFWEYEFQGMKLDDELSITAICRIFETLNSTGQSLDPFDICVARYMVDKIDIKKMLDDAINNKPNLMVMFQKQVGDKVEYINRVFVLQTIALAAGQDNKQNMLAKSVKKEHIEQYWDPSVSCLDKVSEILDGLARTKSTLELLPYSVSIPVMAAALVKVGYLQKKEEEKTVIRDKIRLYFLYTAFNRRYGEGAPNKMKMDYEALCNWIERGRIENNAGMTDNVFIPHIYWNYEELKAIKKGDKTSVANAIRCILFSKTPVDLFTGNPVRFDKKNQHHLFPVEAYKEIDVDSIFNIAYLEKDSNVYISNNKVPVYYRNFVNKRGEETVCYELESHFIDEDLREIFLSEDYENFIFKRSEKIKDVLIKKFRANVIE